ncbi:cell division control protein 6 homolog [Teleopsis dalmanni]|uniref:cell division control protein 6 homolog n=1 Tax=Teleopsis dalmanni TaxID=139649 RepID=UPI0018CE1391|nr:cell division control protein 6 homolog [Teleopsis dalmanni]
MATVRRSTRLSSVVKSSDSPNADIWHRRQVKNAAVAESDNDDVSILTDEENNENSNMINKLRKKSTDPNYGNKTPRSKKINKPMPASKKLELLSKRKTSSKYSDSSDDESETSEKHASPPKQPRPTQKSNVLSPTRLLDRLSIDERKDNLADNSDAEEANETKKKSNENLNSTTNKYQNARRVLNSAETQHMPGREEQLNELREFFSEHLNNKTSASLYVSGQPGTGKTACLSLLLRSPEFSNRLQRVYINCTSIATVGGVYKKLCSELNLQPAGRNERDYLAAIQQHLRKAKRMLLIVLDEIDQLCNSKQSVLYTIFEWPAIPDAKLLLVGIANSLDLTDRALLRLNARCELKPRLMHFPPYTKEQIVSIFKARLAEADVLDIFPPVTLQLLAAKVSAVSGDVRRALDIGRRVVEIAEQQKKSGQNQMKLSDIKNIDIDDKNVAEEPLKPVQITQVAAVLNKVYGASQNLQEDIEESFPLQQKIMLCTLVLMLRKEKNKDITIGRLHEVYRRVCAKRNIHSVDQTEFAGLVDLVETRGILRIMRKKEPRLNKVVLQWDEEEVNGALRDKQLIASILDDTACLSK